MLQRMRDLKVQYKNEVLDDDDKAAIVAEAKALTSEIKDIQSKTEFNGISLHNASGTVSFQVGANSGETIDITKTDLTGASGVGSLSAIADTATWEAVDISDIDDAIKNVSTIRGEFGAAQNRLEHRLTNLATYQENLVASESRIRDVDMASEMVNFTKLGILQQAGTSMLAQANQAPQSVLSLLR
jgi:flagellin